MSESDTNIVHSYNESASSSAELWFYELQGERKGPFSKEQMLQMIQDKAVSFGTMVWTESLGREWIAIEHSEFAVELFHKNPPPLPKSLVNNTFAWVLAFAPLIGYFLEYFFAGMFGLSDEAVSNGALFYITIGLNVLLSFIDERKISKAGYDTNNFRGWVWLVPVYLFIRAKYFNQSKLYFFVWIFCFLVFSLELFE